MIIAGLVATIGRFIGSLILGALAGLAARAVVPGKDDLSMPMTILLGILGGFLGGILGSPFGGDDGLGFIMSFVFAVIGAALLLFGYNRFIKGKAAA